MPQFGTPIPSAPPELTTAPFSALRDYLMAQKQLEAQQVAQEKEIKTQTQAADKEYKRLIERVKMEHELDKQLKEEQWEREKAGQQQKLEIGWYKAQTERMKTQQIKPPTTPAGIAREAIEEMELAPQQQLQQMMKMKPWKPTEKATKRILSLQEEERYRGELVQIMAPYKYEIKRRYQYEQDLETWENLSGREKRGVPPPQDPGQPEIGLAQSIADKSRIASILKKLGEGQNIIKQYQADIESMYMQSKSPKQPIQPIFNQIRTEKAVRETMKPYEFQPFPARE